MRSNSFLNRSRRLKGGGRGPYSGLTFLPKRGPRRRSFGQDRHDLYHLISPRDLCSCQNLPISALANFKPVTISDRSEQVLSQLIEQHPYRHFPVLEDGHPAGVATRVEIEAALAEHRPFKLHVAVTCRPGQFIRESQAQLIQSSTGTLAITDDSKTKLLGIATLHDLLRAQLAVAERERASNEWN